MVKKGIALSHVISKDEIEVNKAKINLIVNLFSPAYVKEVRSFLRHDVFYHLFIKDFSNIAKTLINFLAQDVPCYCSKECYVLFFKFKEALTSTRILHPPIWGESFELICDASDYAVEVILGQRVNKNPHVIYYSSHTMCLIGLHCH